MNVVWFKPEHIELAQLDGYDVEEFVKEKTLQILTQPNQMAGTFMVDGKICAFAGLMVDQEIGRVWLVPTIYLKQHYIGVSKALRQYIKQLSKTFGLKELKTSAHSDVACRFMKFLGFAESEEENIFVRSVSWA